ncbi:dihydroneopterin aldolase [Hoeflea sp. G2-23]|uniref:Dihydroneopterin aldolase n=1 Tax=Hoeflea algicola TaxID=2983763 RepID=A0ABT3Z4C6_9HYPH|nr:dihydroneopterin aldolase [Hoeflea algicola]MCY0146564.1 dihydroneopterin aldolase [Hoeflea algicola]
MSDYKILIEDIEIEMYLGIHDFEKKQQQRVLLNIDIDISSPSPMKEHLFDYDKVVHFIRKFNGRSIETQEELIETVYNYIIDLGAKSAKVYSRKPDVYKDCKSVGVVYQG